MARTSQTDVAVLAVLSVRPMTGYAVREAIRDQLGHFWSESFGQIYPTLARLHSADFISKADDGWALTEAGRSRLIEMLQTDDAPAPPRNPVLLRLFFGSALGTEASRRLIEETRARALAQLERFATIRAELDAEDEYAEHQLYWSITVSAGEHSARATVAWADESLAALASVPSNHG